MAATARKTTATLSNSDKSAEAIDSSIASTAEGAARGN